MKMNGMLLILLFVPTLIAMELSIDTYYSTTDKRVVIPLALAQKIKIPLVYNPVSDQKASIAQEDIGRIFYHNKVDSDKSLETLITLYTLNQTFLTQANTSSRMENFYINKQRDEKVKEALSSLNEHEAWRYLKDFDGMDKAAANLLANFIIDNFKIKESQDKFNDCIISLEDPLLAEDRTNNYGDCLDTSGEQRALLKKHATSLKTSDINIDITAQKEAAYIDLSYLRLRLLRGLKKIGGRQLCTHINLSHNCLPLTDFAYLKKWCPKVTTINYDYNPLQQINFKGLGLGDTVSLQGNIMRKSDVENLKNILPINITLSSSLVSQEVKDRLVELQNDIRSKNGFKEKLLTGVRIAGYGVYNLVMPAGLCMVIGVPISWVSGFPFRYIVLASGVIGVILGTAVGSCMLCDARDVHITQENCGAFNIAKYRPHYIKYEDN